MADLSVKPFKIFNKHILKTLFPFVYTYNIPMLSDTSDLISFEWQNIKAGSGFMWVVLLAYHVDDELILLKMLFDCTKEDSEDSTLSIVAQSKDRVICDEEISVKNMNNVFSSKVDVFMNLIDMLKEYFEELLMLDTEDILSSNAMDTFPDVIVLHDDGWLTAKRLAKGSRSKIHVGTSMDKSLVHKVISESSVRSFFVQDVIGNNGQTTLEVVSVPYSSGKQVDISKMC